MALVPPRPNLPAEMPVIPHTRQTTPVHVWDPVVPSSHLTLPLLLCVAGAQPSVLALLTPGRGRALKFGCIWDCDDQVELHYELSLSEWLSRAGGAQQGVGKRVDWQRLHRHPMLRPPNGYRAESLGLLERI